MGHPQTHEVQEEKLCCVSTLHYWTRQSRFVFIKTHSLFDYLPSVGPKQLCALAHLGCTCKAVTSQFLKNSTTKVILMHILIYHMVNFPWFQGRVKRRKKLREKWFFDCSCKRCEDPTEFGSHVSTLKCPNCSLTDGGLLTSKSGDSEGQMCSKCGTSMTSKEIDSLENE